MCLYPRLIPNPKYKTSKKRGYYKPSPHDARLNYEATSDVAAIRAFCPLLAEAVNVEDYKLYKVGTFDRHSLAVCSCGAPQEVDYMPYFLGWLEKNVIIKEAKK